VLDELRSGNQYPWGAESALQRVVLVELALQLPDRTGTGKPFDRFDHTAVHLCSEHEAAPHDLPIDTNGARTAHAVFAAKVRPRQAELFAQEADKMLPYLDAAAHASAVDRHGHIDPLAHDRWLDGCVGVSRRAARQHSRQLKRGGCAVINIVMGIQIPGHSRLRSCSGCGRERRPFERAGDSIPAALTTLPHFATSAWMVAASSPGYQH
jgi:hypothetical protein